jgi:hypothetical protein
VVGAAALALEAIVAGKDPARVDKYGRRRGDPGRDLIQTGRVT